MNLSTVFPPISLRTIPPSADGVIFSVLKGGRSAVTLGLIESTEGGFFENGATFMWNAALPVKLLEDAAGRHRRWRRNRIIRGRVARSVAVGVHSAVRTFRSSRSRAHGH